jgi:2-polyprenyl-3-methyl-5-hydroxy-6-metoxy-1,4-benzoquinol methylase
MPHPQLPANFRAIFNRNTSMTGEVVLPCLPSQLDDYVLRFTTLFDCMGKTFSQDEADHLRKLIKLHLDEGFKASAVAKLIVKYEPSTNPPNGITYTVSAVAPNMADQFTNWSNSKEKPLFGTHADARILAAAKEFSDPAKTKILDIGAGTGRNTIPLAKLGYKVDAVEVTPVFTAQIAADAAQEGVSVNVITGDILDPLVRLRALDYNLIISAEVVSHFRDVNQMRLLFAKVCDYLKPNGILVFSMFLPNEGFEPDALTKEVSELVWASLFTEAELQEAMDGLPLEIIARDPVCEYERANLPEEAWPPTGWFENWSTGKDLFAVEDSQMTMQWITCKRI